MPLPGPRPLSETVVVNLIEAAASEAEVATQGFASSQIEALFAPVHEAVPVYADFHYSVLGEYIELTEVAFRATSLSIEEQLFAGFDQRLEAAMTEIDAIFNTEFGAALDRQIAAGLLDAGPGVALSQAHELALSHTASRALIVKPFEAILVAGATTMSAKAAAAITETLFASIAAKLAIKAVAKPASTATGIGGGAAVGVWFGGPLGAAVEGAIGGAIVWFGTDYAVIKVDEYFTREDFETELHSLIDDQQATLKDQIMSALVEHRLHISGMTVQEVRQASSRQAAHDQNATDGELQSGPLTEAVQ